ncbi:hypothetical protein ZIOFF_005568 [Zingiber officinale]|uniref:Uncharacterized protein n=1 Tax=Zingiber officinale TaxID=94328 RepID=A0A8J5M4E7_ZINOF|nr:hypothetical protein ZIOFF_005568 [Zingiber officinale]
MMAKALRIRNEKPDLTEEKEIDCSKSKSHDFVVGFVPFKSSKQASKPSMTPCDLSLLSLPPLSILRGRRGGAGRQNCIAASRSHNQGETLHMHHEKVDDLEASLIGYEAKETSGETEETMIFFLWVVSNKRFGGLNFSSKDVGRSACTLS